MKILLVNPPLSDPQGPYPAICYLAGYLDTIGHDAVLADASLALLQSLFTAPGIASVADEIRLRIEAGTLTPDALTLTFLDRQTHYARSISTAVACLQGRDAGAMGRASRAGYFPPPLAQERAWANDLHAAVRHFEAQLGPMTGAQRAALAAHPDPACLAFGSRGSTDEIRFRASRAIEDVCEVIRLTLDPDFRLDAYAAELAEDCPTFDRIRARLIAPPTPVDRMIDALAADMYDTLRPEVLGLSVPFPGSLQGALRIAGWFRRHHPDVPIVMGGGWVNTQLRHLTDPGIFDYVDFLTLDDGETPLRCVLEFLQGQRTRDALVRTFLRDNGAVRYVAGGEDDVSFAGAGTPTYRGLPLDQYFAFRPTIHAFPRRFGRRWNKLTLARGCYWKRCTFCDTELAYIKHYEPAAVDTIIARIRRLIDETGETGFHFVDEALPPALLKRLAQRLAEEDLTIAWWGNARFDHALADMAPLLAASGCVGITGGLEVPVARLLGLIDKGVSLEQAAQVCHALSGAGIHTHAYLIFGYPTETAQDTIDGLEFVRQLFAAGCLASVFWHRFTLTAYSPMAQRPSDFGITVPPQPPGPFSHYALAYDEPGAPDHAAFHSGLRRATDSYTTGAGLDRPLQSWFTFDVPGPGIPPDLVARAVGTTSAPRRTP